MQSGVVFNIQQYSLNDGPGIRTTVFLKGCPLRCLWCHNPESMAPKPEIIVIENRCIGCGCCREVCPNGQSFEGSGAIPARSESCRFCGACVEACPTGARQTAGKTMTTAEVVQAILKDRVFYDESGGGVTFSGGEPLCQADFLREVLGICRGQGIRTAVDTCGFTRKEELLSVAALTDLFLYDLKVIDDAKHREYTGVSNSVILDNLQALGRVHDQIWLRIPVIPTLTDSPADLDASAQFAARIPAIRQVNLLPYHKTGLAKARRLGRETKLDHIDSPSTESMNRAVAIFKNHGLVAKIGG